MKKLLLSVFVLSIFFISGSVVSAFDSGCTPNGPYSTTTGKLCVTGPNDVVCPFGDKYSRTSGKLCTAWYSAGNSVVSSQGPLTIVTNSIQSNAVFGQNYFTQFKATGGGAGMYTWKVSEGALPPGLTLSPFRPCPSQIECTAQPDAILSGKPNRSGKYTFTISVSVPNKTVSRTFTINISTI